MITLTYLCQNCEKATRGELTRGKPIACMHCGQLQTLHEDVWDGDTLNGCVICPSEELYVRKDFSQRLGVSIIVMGFALSSIANFFHHGIWAIGILVATAGVDALLYYVTGNALHCYRCHSELRGLPGLEDHDAFDLEIHERHRQQAARLAEAERAAAFSEQESETER